MYKKIRDYGLSFLTVKDEEKQVEKLVLQEL